MSGRLLRCEIAPDRDGRRVRGILQGELGLSAGLVTSLKHRQGAVKLNGKPARTVDIVRAGDILTAEVGDARVGGVFAPMGRLDILYEDEDILVINKSGDMATHGRAEKGEATVANAVAAYLGTQSPFHPVNRLDRGTTGVMCIAKTGYAHDRLRRLLHSPDFHREYLAVTVRTPEPREGRIELPVGKVSDRRFGTPPTGAPSATDYETVAEGGGVALLRVRPLTGRTHQIRVHLAAVGCPILADAMYGTASAEMSRPALHSRLINLLQPVTGERICVEAPLPEDMKEVLLRHEIEADIL